MVSIEVNAGQPAIRAVQGRSEARQTLYSSLCTTGRLCRPWQSHILCWLHMQVWLLDSLRKRCDFVQGALARLGIRNARTLWGRAETLGQDAAHREAYDVAVARAVADMRVLSELCLPFVRTGGHFVAAKGPHPVAEVAAAKHALHILGGHLVDVREVDSLSEEGQPRTAVTVRKDTKTPEEFPRREGKPSKRPL